MCDEDVAALLSQLSSERLASCKLPDVCNILPAGQPHIHHHKVTDRQHPQALHVHARLSCCHPGACCRWVLRDSCAETVGLVECALRLVNLLMQPARALPHACGQLHTHTHLLASKAAAFLAKVYSSPGDGLGATAYVVMMMMRRVRSRTQDVNVGAAGINRSLQQLANIPLMGTRNG